MPCMQPCSSSFMMDVISQGCFSVATPSEQTVFINCHAKIICNVHIALLLLRSFKASAVAYSLPVNSYHAVNSTLVQLIYEDKADCIVEKDVDPFCACIEEKKMDTCSACKEKEAI